MTNQPFDVDQPDVIKNQIEEVRQQVIELSGDLNGECVRLTIDTSGYDNSRSPRFDPSEYRQIGVVRVPITGEMNTFTLDCPVYVGTRTCSEETSECFRRLCNKAGGQLPVRVVNQLSPYLSTVGDLASRWFAYLLHERRDVCRDETGRHREELVILNPLGDSLAAIEALSRVQDEIGASESTAGPEGDHVTGAPDRDVEPLAPTAQLALAAEQQSEGKQQADIALRRITLHKMLKPRSGCPEWVTKAIEHVAISNCCSWEGLSEEVGVAASTIRQSRDFGKHESFAEALREAGIEEVPPSLRLHR